MAENHQKWLDRGRHLIHLCRYEQAEVEVRRALVGEVDKAFAFYLLAWAQQRQGRFKEAEENAGRAIAENPKWGGGFHVRALALQGQGRWVEAEKAIRSAIACNPQYGEYHADLAYNLRHQGRQREALSVVDEALRIEPLLVRLHVNRTGALIELRNWNAAWDSAMHALSLDPEDSDSRQQLGDIAFELWDYVRAQQHYAEALRLDPKNTYIRGRLLKAVRQSFWFYSLFEFFDGPSNSAVRIFWPMAIAWMSTSLARYGTPGAWAVAGLALLFLMARPFLRAIVEPVMTLRLRFHRIGRTLLSRDEMECSNIVALLLGGAALLFSLALPGGWGWSPVMLTAGFFCLILVFPVTRIFQTSGRRRAVKKAYVWVLASIGALSVAALAEELILVCCTAMVVCALGALCVDRITDSVYSRVSSARKTVTASSSGLSQI